jgi:hypothetical protein
MKYLSAALGTVLAFAVSMSMVSGPASAASKSQLRPKALSLSNMPTGWSVNNSNGSSTTNCGLKPKLPKHDSQITVSYIDGQAPSISQVLATGPTVSSVYNTVLKNLEACKTITVSSGSTKISGTGGAMSYPSVGAASAAYAFNLTDKGVAIGLDAVLFKVGKFISVVSLVDLGTPDTGVLEEFVTEAIAKIEGRPTTTPTTD